MNEKTETSLHTPAFPENLKKHVHWLAGVKPARNFINPISGLKLLYPSKGNGSSVKFVEERQEGR